MASPVQPKDRSAWWDKNLRLNQDITLAVGMLVRDAYGLSGQVIEVIPGFDLEDHGTITVRTETGYEEHYSHWGWKRCLRILENKE